MQHYQGGARLQQHFDENSPPLLDFPLFQVPLLTAEALRRGDIAPNSLVRVVGMVQDSWEQEYYPSVVPSAQGSSTLTYGAFRDTVAADVALPAGTDLSKLLMGRCDQLLTSNTLL